MNLNGRDGPLRFGQDTPALDLIINDKFLEVACACEICTKTFARIKKLIAAIDDRPEEL